MYKEPLLTGSGTIEDVYNILLPSAITKTHREYEYGHDEQPDLLNNLEPWLWADLINLWAHLR